MLGWRGLLTLCLSVGLFVLIIGLFTCCFALVFVIVVVCLFLFVCEMCLVLL